ncbi:hypothetical protein ID866_5009 [Astraeus odoratus]|nr:hypothetical protein ID866_5009 [Astraeus odoratus]
MMVLVVLDPQRPWMALGQTILQAFTFKLTTWKMSKYAPHSRSAPRATATTTCQKCLQTGASIQRILVKATN